MKDANSRPLVGALEQRSLEQFRAAEASEGSLTVPCIPQLK